MLMVGHTALGIASGLLVPQPLASLGVGVITHHLADATPHWDPGSYIPAEIRKLDQIQVWEKRDWLIVTGDMAATALLLAYLLPLIPTAQWVSVGAGILGANLPDLVHNVPFWNRQLLKIGWIAWWRERIHRRYQWTVDLPLWYLGVATQIVTIGLVVWLVLSRVGSVR